MPLPRVGTNLQIRPENSKDYYRSRLVDLSDSSYFIDVPCRDEDYRPCHVTEDELFWVHFQAPDGSLCKFTTHKVGTAKLPMPCWEVTKPELKAVERLQRREFVRVSVDLPLRVVVMNQPPVECYTRNLSGGGMSLHLPKGAQLDNDSVIDVRLTLMGDSESIYAKCCVLRVSEPDKEGRVTAAIKFVDMSEAVRKRIVQFIFNRQRKSL